LLLATTAAFPLMLAANVAYADGAGGANSAALGGSSGINGGAGGGGGVGGVGGSNANSNVGVGGSGTAAGAGGAGSGGNAVTLGDSGGAAGAGGSPGTASSPTGGNGGNGGTGSCFTCLAGFGGGGGGGGGDGLVGATLSGVSGAITGGNGGDGGTPTGAGSFGADGGSGGGAGAGAVLSGTAGSSASTSANVIGGNGGAGGGSVGPGGAGFGGGGGSGIVDTNVDLTNRFSIAGGTGGAGGNGASANEGRIGGAGGAGVTASSLTLTNTGTIQGGHGGATGANAAAGSVSAAGGAGVQGSSLTLTNTGTIQGGAGGSAVAGTVAGAGGAGVQGASLQIVNGGTIAGGLSSDGATRANAITFTSGANSLQLQQGWNFVGNVVTSSGATSTLILGGNTTDLTSNAAGTSVSTVFSLPQIGTVFQGFSGFEKTGASTWALTGSTSAATPWTISAGTLQLGDGTTNGSVTGDIADNATLAFDPAAGTTIANAGTISGTGAVQQIGAGTTVLTAANTYAGGTTISAGTLQVSADDNLGATAGALTLDGGTLHTTASFVSSRAATLGANGGTFDVDPGTTLTMSGAISGAGALTKTDAGTLLLTGANRYAGGTTISTGTLQLGDGTTNGSITGNVTDNATLAFDPAASTTMTEPGVISGAGAVQQIGAGTTVLTGASTYTGGTTISAGALQLGDSTTNGSITGSVTNNATLAFDPAANTTTTEAGAISGGGAAQQIGAGTTVLTGASTYSGGTTISNGTLQLTTGTAAGTGAVSVNTTAGDTAQGLSLDFASADTFANTLTGSGATTVAAGSATAAVTGANSGYAGNWQINGNAAIASSSTTSATNLGTGAVNIASGGSLAATTAGAFSFDNALSGSGTLSASNGGGAFSFGSGAGAAFQGTVALSNDTFALSGTNTAALTHATLSLGVGSTTTVGDGNQAIGALTFNGGTAVFDATAPAQQVATSLVTTGSLDVSGAGTVEINVPNPYGPAVPTPSGDQSLFQQSHANNGLELVSATSVTGNASALTLEDQNGAPLTAARNVNIAQGGNVVAIGSYGYSLGTGPANNGLYVDYTLNQLALQAGQSLTLTEDPGATGDNADMAAQLTGSGNLVIAANNVVSLSNTDNTFTGATTLQSGTLQANAANVIASSSAVDIDAGSTFDTHGFSQSLNKLTGAATASLLLSGGDTLTLNGSGTPTTFAGTISGAGSLVQASGTEVLTGANTYTGGTTIGGGTLQLGDGTTNGSITGNVTDNATLAFNPAAGTTLANASAISGTGQIAQIGAGTTNLTGDSGAFAGTASVTRGSLQVSGTLGGGASTVNVSSGATLGGSGTIGGNAGIGGGTLAPGNVDFGGSPGTLAIGGNLALTSASTLDYHLGQANVVGGPSNDLTTVGGNLTLAGTVDVSTPVGRFDPGLYRIISYNGALTDNGLAIGSVTAGGAVTVQTSIAGQVNLVNTSGAIANFWDGAATSSKNNGAVNGGDGVWQSSAGNDNWTTQTGALNARYPDGTFAIFAANAGTVTVDDSLGAVTSGGMQFATNGYVINGGPVTLAAGSDLIRVGDGTAAGAGYVATIASQLTGSGGLNKDDLGKLVLSGANHYTGGTTIDNGTLQLGDGTTNGAVTGDIADNATLAFDPAAGTTIDNAGVISGSGAVQQTGTGTTVLTAANTYTGDTTISAGTLQLGDGATNGSITGHVTDNATLAFDPAAGTTIANAGVISGSGAIQQIGAGTTVLSGANSYAGGTTIDAGTLQVASDANLGATSGALAVDGGTLNTTASFASSRATTLGATGGTFDVDSGTALTMGGAISGPGALTKTDAGTLLLTAANTYAGGTTIGTGTLQLGDGATNGSITGNIADNATLAFDPASGTTLTEAGAVSGAGQIQQAGAGTTNLTGDSSAFSGPTTVSAGSLTVSGTLGNAASTVSVGSGGSLGGGGTIGGSVSVADGTLAPGNASIGGGPGTLTIGGDLALSSASALDYHFGQTNVPGGPLNDLTAVAGNLTLAGTLNVSLSPAGSFEPGLYRIISYGGALTNDGLALGALPTGTTESVQTSIAGQVNLVNSTGVATNFWDGAASARNDGVIEGGNGAWQSPAGNDNWAGADGAFNVPYTNGSFAIFSAAPGTVSVDDSLGNVVSGGMQFATSGYLLQGDPITLAAGGDLIRVGDGTSAGAGYVATIAAPLTGSGGIDKADLGTLVLAGANSYTGGTAVGAGTLRLQDAGTLGASAGATTVAGGTLDLGGTNQTQNAGLTLASGAVNDGTLSSSTGFALRSGSVGASLAGSGALGKSGPGTVTLTGNNTYTGATTVSGGTLALGSGGSIAASSGVTLAAAGATFDTTAAGNQTIKDLAAVAGSTVNLGASTLAFGTANSTTFAGSFAGTGTLNWQGGGTFSLTGDSSGFAGTTTIDAGTVAIGTDAVPNANLGGNVDVTGGTLKGLGTIGGNLVNTGGTVQPGGSIGTLMAGGNYTQRAGGTLAIQVSPGAASQLKVGGAATIDGKLALLFAPGTYQPASYRLLSAQSVGGTFAQVSGANPNGLAQSIDYHPADVTLRLGNPASTGLPGLTTPPGVVAPTHDTIYTTLTSMALLNAQQMNGIILDRIGQRRAGVADGPVAALGDPSMRVQVADTGGHAPTMLSPSPASRGAWFRGIGNFTSLSGRAGVPGFTGSTGGFMLGYDQPVNDTLYLGAAAGYLNSSIDEHSNSSGTLQSARVALYGGVVLGPSLVTATAGYAHDWMNTARGLAGVGAASESHGGDEATLAGQWSMPLAIPGLAGGSATLTPKAGVQYVHLSEGAFAETGAGTFDLGANGRGADSLQPYVGFALSQRFATRGGTEITPELRLGYAYETLANARRLAVFAADGTAFPVSGIPPSRNQLSAGLGLTMTAGPNLSFYASYDAILPVGNTRSQTFQAGLRWKF
jgi:fibronectin-binding autotransporter adhesin